MKQMFKQIRDSEQKAEAFEESKDSIAENITTKNNFLSKLESETDIYDIRKRFCIIPVE